MIGTFLALASEKLDGLVREPSGIADFLAASVEDQDELGADFLDIDKAWQGIHFLLTGSAQEGEPPLRWAILGPTEIGEDLGNGPARALTSAQVIEISQALAPITADKLKRKYVSQTLNDAEIYPRNWRTGDEDYLAENFASLKKFYESAARRRMCVIQWRT